MGFGERLRALRLSRRLTQRQLAELVDLDFTYLSKIENGKAAPPSETKIRALAGELQTDAEELLSLAGKVSQSAVRETVARDERMGVLFRRLQRGQLSSKQIRELLAVLDESGVKGDDAGNY